MDLRRFDLNLLVVLEAILRTGSTSSAARELNLTQPAISQSLKRARAMFGDPLLLRTGRAMTPTARGTSLRATLPAVLDGVSGLLAKPVFEPKLATRTFRIATSDLGDMVLLPRFLARATHAAPLCSFEILPVRHDVSDDMPDAMLMGAAPPRGPWLSKDVFKDRFVLLARKGHPALRGRLTLKAFCGLPQALVSPRGGGFAGFVDDALEQLGLRRSVTVSLPRFGTLPQILAQSDLTAAVPQRFATLPAVTAVCGWRALPLDVPQYSMRLVWHRSRDTDPAQQWLRGLFTEA